MNKFKGFGNANIKNERFEEIKTNLYNLERYKHLKGNDRRLINKIHLAYSKKGCSFFMIRLIYKFYNDFFPDLKRRKGLSKLNYAIKFSKGT